MKKQINLSVKRETISKLQNFNFAQVMGGEGAGGTVKFTLGSFKPPVISKETYTCAVCDNV